MKRFNKEKKTFLLFFFNDQQTQSQALSGAPTGQTEYFESNPSPPPILGKTR
ncbi:hypothetical protein Hdeb2414_s0024g00653411 [Helianthus debilis subsp. tardiflorus]